MFAKFTIETNETDGFKNKTVVSTNGVIEKITWSNGGIAIPQPVKLDMAKVASARAHADSIRGELGSFLNAEKIAEAQASVEYIKSIFSK